MRRLVIPGLDLDRDQIVLRGDEAQYVGRVLRLGPGDELLLLDGQGRRASAVVEGRKEAEVRLRVDRRERVAISHHPPLHLIQGLTKGGGKLDEILRRATELGVAAIHPALCARSVARPPRERAAQRLGRWRKIAAEASRQCGRDQLPEVRELAPLDEVLRRLRGEEARVVLWEDELETSLAERLERADLKRGLILVIGPEGGLTGDEVTAARDLGYLPASMGPLILRTETAAIAACTLAQQALGGLSAPKRL